MAKPTPTEKRNAETVTPIWLGLAAVHRRDGVQRVRVRWLQVAAMSAGLLVAVWLMGALGMYFWFKLGRNFTDERYTENLAWPLWLTSSKYSEEHHHKMGEYYLQMGDLHLKGKRYPQAMDAFRLGVMWAPESLHGREMLSDFYYYYYRNEQSHSLEILEGGLPYAISKDRDYVNNYMVRLQQAHEPDKIIEVCQKYIAAKDCSPEIRGLLAINLAQVYIDLGRYDEAEDTISHYDLEKSLDGTLLTSRLLWERGRLYDTVKYLEAALPRFHNNDAILDLLSRFYRDLGDIDNSMRCIHLLILSNPSNAKPRIDLMYIYAKTGDDARIAQDSNTIIEQFHNDAEAMARLANFATDQGNVKLMLQLYQLAQDQVQGEIKAGKTPTFDVATFALLVTQAYIVQRQYDDAIKFLDNLDVEKPAWLEPNRNIFDSMRALADYGIGKPDLTDMYLSALIGANKTRPDIMLTIANRFLAHDDLDDAEKLFRAAYQLDPHNQAALAQLVTVDLLLSKSTDLSGNLEKLLQTRRPPLELLDDARRTLGGDRFIFVPNREQLLSKINVYIAAATKSRQPDAKM